MDSALGQAPEALRMASSKERVQKAIDRLRFFESKERPYYLAFSGGKDSIVIKRLADISGVKYEPVYNLTTIDPPELVQFIRKYHRDVRVDRPLVPFLTRMAERGFPMRHHRWCCEEYKERGGYYRTVVTGVRWAESYKRKARRLVEACYKNKTKTYLNVIIDWTNKEVWDFIRQESLPYCELYDAGWERIGCLFCPLAGRMMRLREAFRYPRYVKAFVRAFERLYANRKAEGSSSVDRWTGGKDMFAWWLYGEKDHSGWDQSILFE